MLLLLPFVRVSPDEDDPYLGLREVMYAVVDARRGTLVYIGIAVDCTLRQRLFDKKKLAIVRKYPPNSLAVFCAIPRGLVGGPKKRGLVLREAEGIIIFEEQPPENIQNRRSCWNEYGLKVVCEGAWYGSTRIYHPDADVFDDDGYVIGRRG